VTAAAPQGEQRRQDAQRQQQPGQPAFLVGFRADVDMAWRCSVATIVLVCHQLLSIGFLLMTSTN
jgi:hypothetical protein